MGMSWSKGGRKVKTHGKRPRAGRDMPGNAKTEEVEKGNAQCNDYARPQYGGIVDHLVPTTREVEEGGTGSPCGHDGHEENNGRCPEKALKADSVERGDGILFHDLFFNDELRCSANGEGYGW